MKIKKVAQTPGVVATVSTSKIDSDKDTYSCNYLNYNRENYSTEEQRIGTWIDGKPLYEKTVQVTSPKVNSSGNAEYIGHNHLIDNIEFAFIHDCVLINGTDYISNNYSNTSGYRFNAFVNRQQVYMVCSHASFSEKPVYVTIRYTKTTD